ncbi:LytR/AlgR family response regulator transcription factor [Amycolatopsis pittospori]|uniref:LytR/AlgR family response regulator transcription factor n=1 Tax=Amycolatopsis pittospori TaxID=2749434 RepID=UPI0015F0457A|nr:LytTR family DNA-binding domain-containing protein [Amycolatopsis pittospori]
MSQGLRVLAVDDMPSALERISRLLRESPEVAVVSSADDPLSALKMIQGDRFDAVFVDIAMPGMNGIDLGGLLAKLADPPLIVFVTGYDEHAADAFDLGAIDYLRKPVSADRLSAALRRVRKMSPSTEAAPPSVPDSLAVLPVDVQGRTRFVRRREVVFVEAARDTVKLHTFSGVHPVRMPLSLLAEQWEDAGFVRTHRSYLAAVGAITELRSDPVGGLVAHTELGDVPVSRRHYRGVRERLFEAARSAEPGRP